MMVGYAKTAIVFGSARQGLLYFDHVIPVNLPLEQVLFEAKHGSMTLPTDFAEEILPPEFAKDPRFCDRLVAVNDASLQLLRKMLTEKLGRPPKIDDLSDGDYASIEEVAEKALYSFVEDFGLKALPLDVGGNLFSEEDDDQSDIVVSLASLRLVDADRCSWEQILEFRRDAEARDKLRRLRLFAYDNYAGKSKEYVEDDILKRIADYDEAVKQWGFETTQSALNMLLNSKIMGGALAGSLVSTFFGAPSVAVATAVGGGVLEIGRIALDVTKQRFALRRLIRENPVSYISHVRSKLEHKA